MFRLVVLWVSVRRFRMLKEVDPCLAVCRTSLSMWWVSVLIVSLGSALVRIVVSALVLTQLSLLGTPRL